MKIIDVNDNKTLITNGQPKKASPSSLSTTPNPAPVRNWASFLQSTAPPTPTQKKQPTPSPILPSEARSQTPVASFNINNESTQPLGVLLLRIMFDPNYSIFYKSLPTFDIKPRGLTNAGNICYMNSILQILLYCEPFNRLLRLIETKSLGSLGTSPTPLLDATITFFNQFQEDSKTPVSPEDFYAALTQQEKFSHLKWGQQEDAEEFLGYYLDGLNEEFISAIKKLNTPQVDSLIQAYSQDHDNETTAKFKFSIKTTIKKIKNEEEEDDGEWNQVHTKKNSSTTKIEVDPTPLNMIFGGEFKSVVTIPKQSSSFQKSITLDPFQHVQLDISGVDSIEEAFKHLNESENISYTNNNKEIQVKKQTFIEKLPNVLIIHLKRFSYLKDQDVGVEKLRKKIDYNHDLTIPKEILATETTTPIKYHLMSVVYHHGSSADAGHYTSDIYNEGLWWRIDDTIVKQIKSEEVLHAGTDENIKNAYILLYRRI
ncbi:UBP3 Ubiquitin carboxyl-terminal hydrolase 3 [Candida maltosa Xu316]